MNISLFDISKSIYFEDIIWRQHQKSNGEFGLTQMICITFP